MEKIVETVFLNLPIGVLVIGPRGNIIDANPVSCDILGCPSDGFVGSNWGDVFFVHEENSEFVNVVFDAIQKVTPRIERVTPYFLPDGEKKFLSVISSTQRGEDGRISAIVVLIEDLTELHGLHEREKRMLAQNHRLATERAESLIAFAQSVAHQIRNPIMSIAGFTRLLDRRADEASRESLEAIGEETRKLETMVRAVTEYSSIALENPAHVNLWVVIEEARGRLADKEAVKGRTITWDTECPDMNVTADRHLLARALFELLLNSIEFAGDGPAVKICAKDKDGFVVISIADNGPGFTAEGLEMAFDPFYTTKPVGAGMGLTRAKRIVNEHQGSMTIGNGPDGGARVQVSIPVDPM